MPYYWGMVTALAALFLTVSQTYNLPPGLLSALCYVESGHDVRALHLDDNGSPSIGVCQVKLSTARLLGFKGSESDLRDPKLNVRVAGQYLSYQLLRYNRNVHKAVSAYNAGTWTVNAQGHTRNVKYVNKVLRRWERSNAQD